MPTVFRFLTIAAALVAVAYAAMFLLVTFVKPRQAEMSVSVPLDHVMSNPEVTGTTPAAGANAAPPAEEPAAPGAAR